MKADLTPLDIELLQAGFDGDLDTSSLARRLYSQDASIYQERPLGVAYPRHAADCVHLVRCAADQGLSLIPRAGGTSLAGQCVGPGLVVDVSRYMNKIISIDPDAQTALVEPGVIQDDLNDAVAAQGLMFAPDTSTSRQANIGGMMGNNSCGAYSVLYGTTREHVLSADVVLSDGSQALFTALDEEELDAACREPSLAGRIHKHMHQLVQEHRETILHAYPRPEVIRRNTGYPLDLLAHSASVEAGGDPWNLARFICGTEGTLCLITRALVQLTPTPQARLLMCVHFDSVDDACRATVKTMAFDPAAVELMDGVLLEATHNNREQEANRFWVEGTPGAVLAIEFRGEQSEALQERADALKSTLMEQGLGTAFPIIDQKDIARVWALRKAGLGILTGIPGDRKPATAIEDAAVPVAELPAFVNDIEALCRAHGCECVYYGHASVGLLHFRPMLNLKEPADLQRFRGILEGAVDVVKRYGGSLSGEHGDGRLRGPFVERMLGPEAFALLSRVKEVFDPRNLFNSGKIINAPPPDSGLRITTGQPTPEIETIFDWSRQKGYVRAAEACNGAGFCRQSSGRGTMCPTYMATGNEALSTRGRANVLRQVLNEEPDTAWGHADVQNMLDTCLSCKGCATECPSSVDMARLKAEWLQHHHDQCTPPLRSRLMGHYAFFARLARVAPGPAGWCINLPIVKRLLGVAPQRTIPAYAQQTFSSWFRRHNPLPAAGSRGEVVLFNDEFTNFTDPHTGIAAVRVLEAAGYRVLMPAHLESGRTQLSKGFLRGARRVLERTVDLLYPFAEKGIYIVGVEPSALLGLRDEAPDLVRGQLIPKAKAVAQHALCFEEFITRQVPGSVWEDVLKPLPRKQILLHGHCHQKALSGLSPTVEAMQLVPEADVIVLDSGCCGMAGSFGYEREHYELSMQIGELVLFPAVRQHPDALICAAGTSCRHQIMDGTQRQALHPAEILTMACSVLAKVPIGRSCGSVTM